ncbi:MAG TPA: dihydrolipoyl dehydrogenase [Thermodesulfovibrionales bacterium]|nr:dihydrolipoyl dehydrogenase [Thermodesulfovibrionales bacterium]
MKKYDVVVVGAGDVGLAIAFTAVSEDLKVALIDKGSVGGTCVNYGCVPSKTLICAADRIMEVKESARLGIHAEISGIDFRAVMDRMRHAVKGGRESIEKALKESENLEFFNREGHFIDERTIEAGEERIRGKKLFVTSGSRPAVPPITGLDGVRYLTNESVLALEQRPESMIIIGGGYVGTEYCHFFSAMGTRVTLVDKGLTLLPFEEPEISELLKTELGNRIELLLGVETNEVRYGDKGYTVRLKDVAGGREREISAEALMVAAGRKSNADLLRVENAGIETDKSNYIKVDDYLRTNRERIWAAGDAIGRTMFTHAGDKEAEIAWHNATQRKKIRMDFGSVPHAVFTYPQIASVGLTEQLARKNHEVLVGRANYSDTVMGEAMAEREGFAKAIVEKESGKILGFHIIGPHAAMLIQEVVNAVILKGDVKAVTGCMHIFPALSNIIPEALGNLE